jgi:hypothetical protein
MKKLAFILLTAVCTFPLFANNPADTLIVLENKKIEIIDEENRLRVRVFDLIEYGEYVERQLAFEGHYRDGARVERRHIVGTLSVPVSTRRETPRRARHINPHWRGIGVGFNYFASDDLSLGAMRSVELTWNIYERALPLSRNFALVTGWGLKWNRYHLNGNVFFSNVDGITMVLPAEEGINLTRSRLGINSITVPLLFEWQIRTQHNRGNFLYVSAGVVGSLNYMSRAKIRYNTPDRRLVGRDTTRGRDLNVRPLTVDLMAQVGISRWIAVYAKYSPMGLFEGNRGPVVNPVSVGVMRHF